MENKIEKEQILAMVKEYCRENLQGKGYRPGDRIHYAGRVYDEKEVCSLVDASLEFWLTAGRYTERFEEGLASFLGVPYCVFVNSGSSANLAAVAALTSPLLGERQLRKGDEVITAAAAFPTTVAPIVQCGAVPVFVDIDIPTYNIDVEQLEEAYTEKTKAVILAHSLGNIFDLKRVKEFCDAHGLWLIEDNCDALGGEYQIEGQVKKTGTIGDIGTSSFYPAHHITTGEGGAVYTSDPLLHKIIRSMRDWGGSVLARAVWTTYVGIGLTGSLAPCPKGMTTSMYIPIWDITLRQQTCRRQSGWHSLKNFPIL